MKRTAIVLAGGSGKRMGTAVKKQYLTIGNMPVLAYSLLRFEKSEIIDEIILVTSEEEIPYCREQFIEKYHITKVSAVIPGGAERCNSVYEGLKACRDCDYVFIHDGARPFIDDAMIRRLFDDVKEYQACIAAVKVKDTIKVAGVNGEIIDTPDRAKLWQAQTPQVFSYKLIYDAYTRALDEKARGLTDDASCIEYCKTGTVHLTEGSYENIKITTPDDLHMASLILSKR